MLNMKYLRPGEGEKLEVLQDNITILLDGNDTDGAFTLFEQDNPPGSSIPMHVHDDADEVFVVLEGEVAYQCGDKRVVAGAGSMVFAPRGIPHSWTTVGTRNARTLVCVYPSGLEQFFRKVAGKKREQLDMQQVTRHLEDINIHWAPEMVAQ